MRARRVGRFNTGSTKAKAAGAVVACTLMLLAGCGGSADAGPSIIRGMGDGSGVSLQNQSVTFNSNGGEGAMAVLNRKKASALRVNTFIRSGHTFRGWATTPTGSVAYTDGATYPFTTSATLYAIWVPTGG